MSNNPNERNLYRLTPQQILAVEALALGRNQREAAEWAGVSREQVNRWCNHHPSFRAELNQRINERRATLANRYDSLEELALDALEADIRAGDPKAYLALLRIVNRRTPQPPLPSTPDEVIDEEVQARRQALRNSASVGDWGVSAIREVGPCPAMFDSGASEAKIRRQVIDGMVERLNAPPTAVGLETLHWRHATPRPFSACFTTTGDAAALDIARTCADPESTNEVNVITPVTLVDLDGLLRLVDLDAAAETSSVGLHEPSDPFELHRLAPRVRGALATLSDERIEIAARRWVSDPERIYLMGGDEAVAIIETLRTACRMTGKGHVYLWERTLPTDHDGDEAEGKSPGSGTPAM